MPHVRPSRPPGATASRGRRSPVLAEREASSTQVPEEEGVELRRTVDGRGDGVLATRPFATGETVMVGFLVGALTGNDSHATQVGPGRWARHGGLGPKVNHSCDPNCGVRLNDGQAFDFVARQPIGAGQELTFDYAMRNFPIDHFPAVCLCGAARCRGSVTGWKDLPAARKADYGDLVAPYLRMMDDEIRRALRHGPASSGAKSNDWRLSPFVGWVALARGACARALAPLLICGYGLLASGVALGQAARARYRKDSN